MGNASVNMTTAQTVLHKNKQMKVLDGDDFNIISPTLRNAQSFFVNNPEKVDEFADYVKNGEWILKLSQPDFSVQLKPVEDNYKNVISYVRSYEESLNGYILPVEACSLLKRYFKNKSVRRSYQAKILSFLDLFEGDDKLRLLLALAYPRFIESLDRDSVQRREHSAFPCSCREKTPSEFKLVLSDFLNSVRRDELMDIISFDPWAQSLVDAIEKLPVCVTVSLATRKDFPLVFANKQFESITGYYRSEILGRNCKFLQSVVTEPDIIERLASSLRAATPVKVALSNMTKRGDTFYNFLATAPAFNFKGEYTHVVGIQYDITHTKATLEQLQTVNQLLSALPNLFY